MKPFNLEEAKAGKPVVTLSGLPVRLICFDRKHDSYPIVGLMLIDGMERLQHWTERGKYNTKSANEYDLYMAPEVVYINIWRTQDGKLESTARPHATEASAKETAKVNNLNYIKIAHPIKIEE